MTDGETSYIILINKKMVIIKIRKPLQGNEFVEDSLYSQLEELERELQEDIEYIERLAVISKINKLERQLRELYTYIS